MDRIATGRPDRVGLVVSDDATADGAIRPCKAEWARFVDACDDLRTPHAESAWLRIAAS